MKITNKRLETIPIPHRCYFYLNHFFSNYHTDLSTFDFVTDLENLPMKEYSNYSHFRKRLKRMLEG
jgi:hypothetical protein